MFKLRDNEELKRVEKGDTNAAALGYQSKGVDIPTKQEDYLLPHFSMLVVGKPGSGKTTLVERLLTESKFYR